MSMPVEKPTKKRLKWLWIVLGSMLGLFILLIVIGLIVGPSETEPTSSEATTSEAVAPPTTTEAAPETTEATEGDRTQEFKDANAGAVWLDQVVAVIETEPDRLEVETTLTDPRGDSGSPEAQSAIEVCEAAVALSAAEYVAVYEADGTSWVLFGRPSFEGECVEV